MRSTAHKRKVASKLKGIDTGKKKGKGGGREAAAAQRKW